MSFQEFIRLEVKAFGILKEKDPGMVWMAVECGAAEKVRMYAENHDYNVSLDELVKVIWLELCDKLVTESRNQ